MPPGIENRDFLTLRRCIRNEVRLHPLFAYFSSLFAHFFLAFCSLFPRFLLNLCVCSLFAYCTCSFAHLSSLTFLLGLIHPLPLAFGTHLGSFPAAQDTNVYEMLSRSVDWPSKPAGTHTKFRATVFAYTRVEPLAGKPHAHICTTLTYTDLKGGLQQKMAGQMEKAMVRRADDGAKAMIKELTKAEGKPKPL